MSDKKKSAMLGRLERAIRMEKIIDHKISILYQRRQEQRDIIHKIYDYAKAKQAIRD